MSENNSTVYKAQTTVGPAAAGLSLIESSRDMLEKHALVIGQGTMDIFSGGPLDDYVANLSGKPIFFNKNMIVTYVTIDTYYIARPQRKNQNPK